MPALDDYVAALGAHLPAPAVDWAARFLAEHDVRLRIARERRSLLGNYKWPQPRHPYHEISVNGNLSPLLFLWVFLHEAAHLEARRAYAGIKPHGHEWQREYARLLALHLEVFPEEVRPLVRRYVSAIPLHRPTGRLIEEALHRYDEGRDAACPPVRLDDLPAGSLFKLAQRQEVIFQSVRRQRTRWLCLNMDNRRYYTVSGRAEVMPANLQTDGQR